jgi:mycofactocin precursor
MLQPTQTIDHETTIDETVAATEPAGVDTGSLTESDLLVEQVSIDGMCGVY